MLKRNEDAWSAGPDVLDEIPNRDSVPTPQDLSVGNEAAPVEPAALAPSKPERPDGQHPVPQVTRQPVEAHPEPDAPRKGFRRRHPIAFAVSSVALVAALGGAGYVYWENAAHFESTDDAFIASRPITIGPKISGYVTDVPVTDNQHLAAGDVIARIDDRDYRTALQQANAQVAAQRASIQNIDAQTSVQLAQVAASQARVNQAQAALVFAQQQATRYGTLAKSGFGTVQDAQQFGSQQDQQQAAVSSSQAALTVAQRQIDTLKTARSSAEANLAQAIAIRDQAQLNLSYTTVTAAAPGRIVSLSAAPGQFAQAGSNLTMFVPDEIWVTANFKETQLDAMRPGQPVLINIDAYPERAIRGHVASVQPGSGTAFSLLPAENATGNYVKVIQRVPVKIVLDNPPKDVAIGPGMSVEPTVRVDPTPSLYERLAAAAGKLWGRP